MYSPSTAHVGVTTRLVGVMVPIDLQGSDLAQEDSILRLIGAGLHAGIDLDSKPRKGILLRPRSCHFET